MMQTFCNRKLPNMGVVFYCVAISVAFLATSNGQVPELPRFSTPNVLDANGNLCSSHRRPRVINCPPYGININKGTADNFIPFTQVEIENACAALNFKRCPAGTNLFPDGNCTRCPNTYELRGDGTGTLYCGKTNAPDLVFTNPFNCEGTSTIKRKIPHVYRPCYVASTAPKVTLDEYYKRDDFNSELTMAACQKLIPLSSPPSFTVTQNRKTRTYNFSLILDDGSHLPNGFLQCQRTAQTYSFTSFGWILFYVILVVAAFILLSYAIYKKVKELKFVDGLKQDESSLTRDSTNNEDVDVEILETRMRQVGYKNDIFGSIAHFTFWGISWMWHLLFLLVTLDEYGMLIGTLCTSFTFGDCAYSWRTGFGCASGCLFSWNWLGGVATVWPYEAADGGVAQFYATVFILGGIMGVWWFGTLTFYSNLKYFFRIRCTIDEATHVVVFKKREKEMRVESEENTVVAKILNKFDSIIGSISKSSFDTEICDVRYEAGSKYFVYQCLKYTNDIGGSRFYLSQVNIAKTNEEFCDLGEKGISAIRVKQIRAKVGTNQISYTLPSIGESVWNEFFTLFYVYQFVFLWLWYDFFYWSMAFVLTLVVILAGVISIVVTRESQKNMKRMAEINGTVTVLRDETWIEISSSEVVPGDVLQLHSGDDVPCDCVLTQGRCVMNESALTGEPTPVPKVPLHRSTVEYGHSSEDMKFTLLSGTHIESVSPGELGDTRSVVIATGAQTKQGELVRSMLYPPKLRFKFDDHFRVVFIVMAFVGLAAFGMILFFQYFKIISIYYGLFTVSQMFSPLIPAVFSAGQARCSSTLKKKNIYCVELPRTYVSAKVKTFCFDKTGTLTKQGMEYFGFCAVNGMNKFDAITTQSPNAEMKKYLGCCHEIEFVKRNDEISYAGNEIDVAMFLSSGYTYETTKKNGIPCILNPEKEDIRLVKRFEFNRDMMMMTVIVEECASNEFTAICKGSYEKVAEKCKPESIPTDFEQRTSELAMQGYYVLGVAKKCFDGSDVVSTLQRSSVEKDFTFGGLLLFKNDLKADTAHVLEEMKEGNIRNVMITGDNIYTACSISKESRLSFAKQIIYGDIEIPFGSVIWRSFPNKEIVSPISLLQRVSDVHEIDLAITGAALNSLLRTPYENLARKDELLGNFVGVNGKADAMRFLLPYTRIFARMKPAQKVEVVKLHMERSITGMCGDGANDAAALRVAHCGVAVATGSSSATIVAPFSSSDASINVAAEVIRQGRGALASAFAGYKRLIMYGQMLLAIRIFLYHSSLQISEIAWIFIDSFINVGFSLTILLSKSSSKLTPTRPTSKLLGLEIFCSLGLQILVLLGMIFGSMGLLGRENWFACKNFDVSQANLGEWWTMGDNFEGAVLATIGTFQMINMGFVFNYGFEYRKWWFKNYGLLALWAIFFAIMCAVLFSPPNYLSCLFRINCGDASLLTRWDALKDIGFTNSLFTPFSDFFPNPFAPPGCPCKDTIAYSGYLDTCEQEYVSCRAPHYNQTFHHNYIPYRFRWILFGVVMVGFAVAILAEWAVVYGPIRRLLRKRKQRKRQALEKDVLTRLHASVQ